MKSELLKRRFGNNMKNIDLLIMMNDLQQFTSPSTTAVSTAVPSSEDFQQNRTQNLANLVGSIGSPQGLSNEELLDIVMSTSPVGASIRGGKVAKSTMKQLLDLSKKYGIGRPKSKPMTPQDYNFRNKLGTARMKNQQTLDKYGIEDPDKQGMVDPVSALLNYFSKN
jgi:hypothetical protein